MWLRAGLRRADPALRCLLLMIAVAPFAVSRSTISPMWDDAYFLDRAVCVNRAVYGLSLKGIDQCLGTMFKSPAMALLLLPAGPLTHDIGQLGVAACVLACVVFGLAIGLAWIATRIGLPLWALAAAATAIWSCGPIAAADAPFLADGAFALLVTIAMLLPVLEYASPIQAPRAAAVRGLLWGGIAGLGALTKVSFGLFGMAAGGLMLLASLWRSGLPATAYKLATAAAICVVPGAMFFHNGAMYLRNGWRSSYGDLAQYYTEGHSAREFLFDNVAGAGVPYWTLCGGLLLAALARARRDFGRLGLGLVVVAVMLAYLLLASGSLNREARFLWPVWLAIPMALASAIAPPRDGGRMQAGFPAAPMAIVAIAWSLSMVSRFDLQSVRGADALLRSLQSDHPIRLVIASDTRLFNFNTLLLAQQVDWNALRTVDVQQVVYDRMEGRTEADSDRKLRSADFVVMNWPLAPPSAPEFTNRLASRFLDTARSCGTSVSGHPGPADTLLFDMGGARCMPLAP